MEEYQKVQRRHERIQAKEAATAAAAAPKAPRKRRCPPDAAKAAEPKSGTALEAAGVPARGAKKQKREAVQAATPEKPVGKGRSIGATPRMKELVRRSRARVMESEAAEGRSPLPKHLQNLKLLQEIPVEPFRSQLPDVHGKKSFTLQPDLTGSSIGVILSTGSFYVSRCDIPRDLPSKLASIMPKMDKKNGMSLGWRKFQSTLQAYLGCPC